VEQRSDVGAGIGAVALRLLDCARVIHRAFRCGRRDVSLRRDARRLPPALARCLQLAQRSL
jgi:hypothetical protein